MEDKELKELQSKILQAEIDLETAKDRLKKVCAVATGGTIACLEYRGTFAAITAGLKAALVATRPFLFLPVPNYLLISIGGLVVVTAVNMVQAERKKAQEEKVKNNSFSKNELFQLEDKNDDK